MKQRRIVLPTLEDAKESVAEASKCDFDTDILYSRVVVNAKSISGVLSLDLARVLTAEYDESNEGFEAYFDTRAAGKTTATQYSKRKREL